MVKKDALVIYKCNDKNFRKIIDEKKFAELNVHPSGKYFKTLPDDLRNNIPIYIKENINLERFIDVR
jgi:hypothetical protein